MILKFKIHWTALKFWAETRKLPDKQDSKIAYSVNGSWYGKCWWLMLMENYICLETSALQYSVDWVLYVVFMITL